MAKCNLHPARDAVFDYNGKHYCQKCKDGYTAAVAGVDVHVDPRDCFVTFDGGDNWHSFSQDHWTGCAHWVAHQKRIQTGYRCMKGYTVRVPELAAYVRMSGTEVKDLSQVQPGDIWVAGNERHCGIVYRVNPETNPAKTDVKKRIVIQHDSSGQHRVAVNDLEWMIRLHGPGPGRFYRK